MTGNVYLVGMPGSGKSETGRLLARRLKVPFVDLDREIERSAGATPREIFERDGEAGYRVLEKASLSHLSARNRAVVACGGGTVIDPDNRALMRASGHVVWLDVPLERLKDRNLVGAERPLLRTEEDLERLWADRRPLYEDAADDVVDASGDPPQIAAEIEALLE